MCKHGKANIPEGALGCVNFSTPGGCPFDHPRGYTPNKVTLEAAAARTR
jgi:hypothetical protein